MPRQDIEKSYAAAIAAGADAATFARVNDIVRSADQALLDEKGLPKRPWYKHLLYAPGLYTGYGVKTVPGVREAIEQKDWAEADVEIGRVAAAVQREADLVNRASDVLSRKPVFSRELSDQSGESLAVSRLEI